MNESYEREKNTSEKKERRILNEQVCTRQSHVMKSDWTIFYERKFFPFIKMAHSRLVVTSRKLVDRTDTSISGTTKRGQFG